MYTTPRLFPSLGLLAFPPHRPLRPAHRAALSSGSPDRLGDTTEASETNIRCGLSDTYLPSEFIGCGAKIRGPQRVEKVWS